MKDKPSISSIQLKGLIVSSVIGVGILTLPNTLSNISGKDGWMIILLTGVLMIPFIVMINQILKKDINMDFFQIGRESLGKALFNILMVIFATHLTVSTAFVSRYLAELIKAFLLPATPIWVIVFMLLLPVIYISLYEIEVLTRIGYLIYPIIVGFVILLIFISSPTAKISNVLPIFKSSYKNIPKGVLESTFSFTGFEIMIFALPYVKDREETVKSSIKAIVIVTLVYASLFILCLTQFSIQQIERQNFPILMVAKMIDLPGFFLQNLDTIFMSIWVMVGFGTMGPTCFGASKTISEVFKIKNRSYIVLALTPIMLTIALIPRNILVLYNRLGKIVNYSTIFSILILPTIIYIATLIKKRRKE